MIEKMMNKAKFTVLNSKGDVITYIEIDLLSVELKFYYSLHTTKMFAKNLRNGFVSIMESNREVEAMYAKKPKKVRLRNTTEILAQVNVGED